MLYFNHRSTHTTFSKNILEAMFLGKIKTYIRGELVDGKKKVCRKDTAGAVL